MPYEVNISWHKSFKLVPGRFCLDIYSPKCTSYQGISSEAFYKAMLCIQILFEYAGNATYLADDILFDLQAI